ncbi:MAG: dTDP-4-amino-4,6-dideoxygalactose transaminase [Candidatus Cloacimonadales bacterium]|nr:dTDP-4-amino-4,6-dideoxygalactose transaminase [Candidatus Cloacimonadales bacterium]
MKIPFNKPLILGTEKQHISKVINDRKISANGDYSRKCRQKLAEIFNCHQAFLTSNCTSALEMATLLSNIEPEDEIIMPSFTHVGTANPFQRACAKIVWCDIRPGTKNIDEKLIEKLITNKTKAVVVVHYAGISCQIEEIAEICRKHEIILIEDCAMAIGSKYNGKALGSFGDLAVVSFHETKNIHCGEGGALLVNNPEMLEMAEILINCGTNRTHFELSKTDHYSWVAKSGNFQMSELQAAFLYPQLMDLEKINNNRKLIWDLYFSKLSEFLSSDQLPFVPEKCIHNAHLFYLILKSEQQRKALIGYLKEAGIESVFHYIPLHNSPIRQGEYQHLPVTEKVASTILRLPLFYGLTDSEVLFIVEKIRDYFK